MKLHPDIEKAINEQINHEFISAYAYLAMAGWFEHKSLSGFAAWMILQGREELGHAMKFRRYLCDRGGRVVLLQLDQPAGDFKSPLAAFEASLQQEQQVSALINRIYDRANEHKDYSTTSFLRWFLDEQVEEEKTVNDMIAKLTLTAENANGLFLLDQQAGDRATVERPTEKDAHRP
jgi:ferritin